MWTLRKDGHEATLDLRAVPGVGAEIILTVDGEMRRTRLYCAHEQAELSGAIADTRAMFDAKGGRELSKWLRTYGGGHAGCRRASRAPRARSVR